MMATTNHPALMPGVEMIAEINNLRQQVHKQKVLLDAIDHVAQRDRELSEAIAHYERMRDRDYVNDPYLRRIYGPPRAGRRREWS